MKRLATIVAAGAFLAVAAPAAAQMTTEIGAKAGVTFSTVDDEDFDAESLLAFGGGGYVRFAFPQGFSIQPELLWMRKGAEQDFGTFEAELKLDYVEVPVLVRYDIPTAGNISPYLFAGPSFAFEISCKVSDTDTDEDFDCDDEEDFETESFDAGATGGAGVGFAAGRGTLFLEGRYTFGLMDIVASEEFEAKNRSAAVMIGYGVPLGGGGM